jgi:dihydrofolate reductase
MAQVLLDMAISLDGLICGPGGADGGLYDWYFNPSDVSQPIVDELVRTTGAIIIGRGAFDTGDEAGGWDDTPYRVPHFVVTHRPPRPAPHRTVEFVFVPDGVPAAVQLAREAAGDRYVTIGGGADIARQCLAENLVDEVQLHLVPIVLGDGTLLFDRSHTRWRLTKIRVIDAPDVTHLRYRIDNPHE